MREREDGRAGGVVRNQGTEMEERGREVAGMECGAKVFKAGGELRVRKLAGLDGHDCWRLGRCAGEDGLGCIAGRPEELGGFVAGACRGKVDFDFLIRGKLADQEVSQVRDIVGSREHGRQKRGSPRERGGDEQQVDGLVESEEVAAGGWIGDGDGAALGDLLREELDYAIARGEDVAEAENSAAGGEDDLLGDTLGCAHDGSWFDCLVGGEQDEARAVGGGSHGQGFRGEDVVGDGGEGLFFHERNVLVGGGVEDDAGTVRGEDVFDECHIGGAAKDGRHEARGSGCGPGAVEGVEMAFRGLEKEQGRRGKDGEAQGEGGADGAACAGDEDGLAVEGVEDLDVRRRQPGAGEKAAPVDGFEGWEHRMSINCLQFLHAMASKRPTNRRCRGSGGSHTLDGACWFRASVGR